MYSALTSEHDVEDTSVKNGNRLDMLHPSRYLAMQMQLVNVKPAAKCILVTVITICTGFLFCEHATG